VALLRKMTCNWTRGKFSPGAAACHRSWHRAPVHGASELSFSIYLESDIIFRFVLTSDIMMFFSIFLRSDFMIPFLVMIWFHFNRFSDWTSPRSEIGLCYVVRKQGNVTRNEWVWRVCDMTHSFSVNSCPISEFWWETSDVKIKRKKQKQKNELAKIRRAWGPTPVARGWFRG